MKDKSIARISDDGLEVEFFMNFDTGGWRKPYTKKGQRQIRSFNIKTSSKEDAIEKLVTIEKTINEEKTTKNTKRD